MNPTSLGTPALDTKADAMAKWRMFLFEGAQGCDRSALVSSWDEELQLGQNKGF